MSMDSIFETDSKPYVSTILNVEEFREKAVKADAKLTEYFQVPAFLHLQQLQASTSTAAEEEEIQAPDLSDLENDCRLTFKYFLNSKGLALDDGDEVINYMDDTLQDLLLTNPIDTLASACPPKESKLKVHKVLEAFRAESNTRNQKHKYLKKGKYFNYRPGELRKGYTEPGKMAAKDIVITAHIVSPKTPHQANRQQLLNAEVRLLLRGDMPLTKVRDKIFCTYDYFSNLQDFQDATNPEDYYLNRYPSSFIFVHDTFYIDKRNPNAQDISEPIRKYMASKKTNFGSTQVADMAQTKVKDLLLRLGQPYVFVHLGDCEHLLIFTDLRLLHPSDNQEIDVYPVFLSDKSTSPKCCVCKVDMATFIIDESDRIPHHPAFMCTNCFNAFHYEGDNRIGKFRAFHYIDRGIFE